MLYEFVTGIVKENLGNKGRKYFPFIFTLFTFILFTNMIGILPYSFTSTSHIAVTFTLALLVFFTVIIVGFVNHGIGFLKLFVPSGLPLPLVPLIAVVEFVSFLARPLSLSVRLAAAMTAGHILLKVFASFVLMLWGIEYVGPVLGILLPIPVIVGLIGLEIFVAFLQAYIFALLASIYLHEAIELH
jgi:F-type H+-transporting ATPase subunit a